MPPLVIATVHFAVMTDKVTEITQNQTVSNITVPSVASSNSTVTSSTSSPERVTSSWTSEIWAPPDDGDVYRLNTPLNAPQPSLDPVTGIPDNGGLLGSSNTDELGWIIPTAIVVIAAMVGVAFLMYFGIRSLELRMLGWCYRNCPCCCRPGGHGRRLLGGERYDNVSDETDSTRRKESVRLRDFRERSPSYGVSRSTAKEYTPPANPFDDDS
ncbi:hypothetical protein BaRGS_00013226 [Batillaria attramentaria]|uniref:Mucin-like protein n=1 Tax=Batillaria attramentaria TaxID=370345 RepID=A0ABD0L8C8_9CAEN